MFLPTRHLLVSLTAAFFGASMAHAQQDAPPVDIKAMLKSLQGLQDQKTAQSKQTRQAAIQQIAAAASSPDKSVLFWEEAVRATQMQGAGKEDSQFRAWRDSEGELFKEREVQNAVHLHLEWLAITLQRSNGSTVKELLPSIINYAHELWADQAWMQSFDEAIKKEKDAPGTARVKNQRAKDDVAVRRTHDSVLNRGLGGSIIVQWLRLGEFLDIEKWENNPGNLDGLYKNIIQPELRAEKDQRVFEFWDTKLKIEADAATKTRLSFEVDKFNSQRRPTLLWNRAQELAAIGQKNRAATEMFNLIKTYPTHPDANDWIASLQALLTPPPPAEATTPAGIPAAVSNGVPQGLPGSAPRPAAPQ